MSLHISHVSYETEFGPQREKWDLSQWSIMSCLLGKEQKAFKTHSIWPMLSAQ